MTLRAVAVALAVAAPANAVTASDLRAQLARERAAWTVERARLVHVARSTPSVQVALSLAAAVSGVPRSRLDRLAWCESTHNPFARNPSGASGLMQFMPSTWAGNRVGRVLGPSAIWDPYASAMGAALHIAKYGAGAWECRA